MYEIFWQGFQMVVPNDEMVCQAPDLSRCLCQSVQSKRRCIHAQMGIYHDWLKTQKAFFQTRHGPANALWVYENKKKTQGRGMTSWHLSFMMSWFHIPSHIHPLTRPLKTGPYITLGSGREIFRRRQVRNTIREVFSIALFGESQATLNNSVCFSNLCILMRRKSLDIE